MREEKAPMDYMLGIITSFTGSNAKEVTLKARGQAITTAVEITRRRFMKELSIGKITIGTEEMPPRRKQSNDGFNDRNHVNTRVGNR
ncbi:MAG: RNA-binding protein [Candidatus Bathyarchaeota archaeon]|nr:RNA-binding protein [Candidatus Bathyarchaeota archaeon]